MNRKRCGYRILLALLLLAGQLLSGCGAGILSAGEDRQETVLLDGTEELLVAVNVDGTSPELVFESVWTNRSKFWGTLLFRGLLMADENINHVTTDLCEQCAVSPDGLSYVFTLQSDVLWHDGEPFTPQDVVWSVEACLKAQETNGYVRKGLQQIKGVRQFLEGKAASISGLEIKGQDLTIRLEEKNDSFLACIAQLAILPKHCFKHIEAENIYASDFWKMPVGTGPYRIVSNENNEAVFVLNENYTGKKPAIKQIRYKVVDAKAPEDFDFTLTSDPDTISRYRKEADYEVIRTNNLYYRYLLFNLDCRTGENEGILENKKVRQALMYGLDRRSMINNLYGGTALNMDCGIPEFDSWYVKKDDDAVGYRPAQARRMLEEAGFDFDKTLVLTGYDTDELSVRLLEEIAACWKVIGVKTEILLSNSYTTDKLFADADWYDIALKNLAAVNYSEWYYEYCGDNVLFSEIMGKHNGFDELLERLDDAKWAYEKNELYREAQSLENELVYKIPLAVVPQYVIYRRTKLEIPEMKFPNMWYYYDLNLSQWKIISKNGTQ